MHNRELWKLKKDIEITLSVKVNEKDYSLKMLLDKGCIRPDVNRLVDLLLDSGRQKILEEIPTGSDD